MARAEAARARKQDDERGDRSSPSPESHEVLYQCGNARGRLDVRCVEVGTANSTEDRAQRLGRERVGVEMKAVRRDCPYALLIAEAATSIGIDFAARASGIDARRPANTFGGFRSWESASRRFLVVAPEAHAIIPAWNVEIPRRNKA